MPIRRPLLIALLLVATVPVFATTFIVPDDAALVQKSDAIVTGVIVAARTVEVEPNYFETFYELAIDGVLKGPLSPQTRLEIHSPGGWKDGRFTIVESSAHFAIGDEVLLFLTRHRGGWTTTDLTLGKFRFALTSGGVSVAVRDAEDIVGWDLDGKVHREKIRRDAEFLQFIRDTVAGRTPVERDYDVEAGEVLAPPRAPLAVARGPAAELSPAPATTYAISFYDCDLTRYPVRWQTVTMDAGVPFFKNAAQNISGRADGGVSVIQNALASWTNDCGSAVNIPYGGTTPNLKNSFDGVNAIIFNDPGDHIAGSWKGGDGVIAKCFTAGGSSHDFDGTEFVTITDSDVIFQDGYAGTEPSFEETMTHELGHGVGFRHADQHYLQSCTAPNCVTTCTDSACNSSVEECSSAAIMTSNPSTALNYTLQQWDRNAAHALYPGSCVTVLPPMNVVATATTTSTVNVSWTASASAVSYNVYRSTDGINYALAGSGTTTSFHDNGRSANTAYLYKVRAVNGGESADSTRDLATTVIFTDDPLVSGTPVKAVHLTQLRTAVDAVRALASMSGFAYTDPTLTPGVTPVKAVHINELRTALDAARAALSLPPVSYGETVATGTTIKAAHITELRNGVK
jgi:hypothetical protein